MRYLNLVIIAALLAGCSTVNSIRLLGASLPEKISFAFRDDRPPEQRQSRTGRSQYGKVDYFGDDRVSPTGPQLFRASLESRLHAMLAGRTVSLSEFNVYVHDAGPSHDLQSLNTLAASRPGIFAGAPFAGLLIAGLDKGKADKKTVRIQIRGTVDRAAFASDTAATYSSRLTEEDMQATLSKALDEATLQVQRILQASGDQSCSAGEAGCTVRAASGG